MLGIDAFVAVHKLHVDVKPMKQKKRTMAGEKQQAADNEVQKLLVAFYQGDNISRMAIKCGDGQEEQRFLADVHQLYRPQSRMSKGLLSATKHRPIGRQLIGHQMLTR